MSYVVVVLVHGNSAGPEDWEAFETALQAACARIHERLVVIRSCANAHDTHRGIDELGLRLANEIVDKLPTATSHGFALPKPKLCVVGHSLGGLVARWALGHLYATGVLGSSVEPCVYMSLCTPHLGVRAPGWALWRSLINLAGVRGHTEQQLVFDDAGTAQPLLDRMATAAGDSMNALELCKVRIVVGMTAYDTLVPAASACIFRGLAASPASASEWSTRAVSQTEVTAPELSEAQPQHWDWPRDAAHGWVADACGELNIPSRVLNGLLMLDWNRLLVSAPRSLLVRKTAHDFPINKGQPQGSRDLSQECVVMLAKILADHVSRLA